MSDITPLLSGLAGAFDGAADDTVDYARQVAPKRTGRFSESITRSRSEDDGSRRSCHIGSPLVSARAHELGAYITAKRARFLQFQVSGRWVRILPPAGVRLRANPTVLRAGAKFPDFMASRLSRAGFSGSVRRR